MPIARLTAGSVPDPAANKAHCVDGSEPPSLRFGVSLEVDPLDTTIGSTVVVVLIDDGTKRGHHRRRRVDEMRERLGLGTSGQGKDLAHRADLALRAISDTVQWIPNGTPRPLPDRLDQPRGLLGERPWRLGGHRPCQVAGSAANRTRNAPSRNAAPSTRQRRSTLGSAITRR